MITIFTDGSSRGNPGPGGWGAIVVADGKTDTEKTEKAGVAKSVTELGGREAHTTNNRMELTAAIEGLKYVAKSGFSGDIVVNSDSSYVINGITKWVHGWKKKGWKTLDKKEVVNRDLWEMLDGFAAEAGVGANSPRVISWNYVGGHVGVAGNERCDEIATSFADNEPVKLFSGALADYSVANILDISVSVGASAAKSEKKSSKARSNAVAYSYVSMVDGIIATDKTWRDCEARVKGKRGAKYKKALNKFDESEIMAQFRENSSKN